MLQVSGLVSIEYSYTAHKMVQSYDIVKKIFLSFYLQLSNPFCKLFDLILKLKKVQVKLNVKYISNFIFSD